MVVVNQDLGNPWLPRNRIQARPRFASSSRAGIRTETSAAHESRRLRTRPEADVPRD